MFEANCKSCLAISYLSTETHSIDSVKNKIICLILCWFISATSFGQKTESIDSLEKNLDVMQGLQKASALYELVYAYLRTDVNKAKVFYQRSKAASANETDDGALAYLMMAQGIYSSRNGLLDSALYFLERAKGSAVAAKNNHALVRIYAALGHTHISSGRPEKGLENMFAGLRVLDKFPDQEMEMKLRTNIGWAYLELKQYRNCIRHGLQNLRIMEGTSYEWIALYTYNNVAVSYGALKIVDSARYFIEKGIRAAERSKDIQSLANAYFILGTIYSEAGQYDLAIEQYLKARPYREKVGNPLFLVSDLYAISELYHKSGNYNKGVEAGKEALKMAEEYNLLLKFEGTYLSLAQNYEGLKDFKNASKFYRLYAMAKDSVYKNASTEAIAEMETRYETEKKEQLLALQHAELAGQRAHIERTYVVIGALVVTLVLISIIFVLLRSRLKRKQEIREKESELYVREAQIQASIQSQENERKRFARDLHDGMGQLISALRLVLHSVHRNTVLEDRVVVASKAENLLNEMHREIRSIAFNLMPQTLLHHGLVPALKEMSDRVNGAGELKIRVNSFEVPDRMSEVLEISLYRVIQEWINNVIKYSNASVIEVQLVGFEDELSVTIEDNGKGFDVHILQSSTGNGWKNIKSRLNLVKGIMEIDSRPDRTGTTVIVKVPLQTSLRDPVVTVGANTQ